MMFVLFCVLAVLVIAAYVLIAILISKVTRQNCEIESLEAKLENKSFCKRCCWDTPTYHEGNYCKCAFCHSYKKGRE